MATTAPPKPAKERKASPRSEESKRRDLLERTFERMDPGERRRQLFLLNDRYATDTTVKAPPSTSNGQTQLDGAHA